MTRSSGLVGSALRLLRPHHRQHSAWLWQVRTRLFTCSAQHISASGVAKLTLDLGSGGTIANSSAVAGARSLSLVTSA